LIGQDNTNFKEAIVQHFDEFLNHLEVELSSDHILIIPSLLWSIMSLDMLSEKQTIVMKALNIVKDKLEEHKTLSFPGAVLLN